MKINKQHKNGIIQLSFLVIISIALLYLSKILPIHTNQFLVDTETQAILDEQKCELVTRNNKRNATKFYVNTINDYTGYKLGLNVNQIDTLLSFFETGKRLYSLKEFATLTALTNEQLQSIGPKLRFPKKKIPYKKKTYPKTKFKATKKFNLNTITAYELEQHLKLPKFIAKRVVKYRKLLKGFKNMKQIENVYSILPYQINRIKENCYLE